MPDTSNPRATAPRPSRKAELKSDYQLNPPAMGVYAIRHLASGKALIERSNNLPGALNRHRFELKLGLHRNAALQADWQRDGEAGFLLEIVDTVAPNADPAFDADGEIAALLDLYLELCPRGAENSYL
ncbi:hypothetical protein AAKU55_003826 [Oxalobacteraceae bacterium GrIS 1.11]